jgi:type II secretion system protein G
MKYGKAQIEQFFLSGLQFLSLLLSYQPSILRDGYAQQGSPFVRSSGTVHAQSRRSCRCSTIHLTGISGALILIDPRAFRHGGRKGFTLIELLIVVAIIGVIAAILIPNLLDSLQKAKQKRTMADMRDLGEAWFSWLTDQVSAAAAGSSQSFNFDGLAESLTADELQQTLYVNQNMFYIQTVPTRDGWGRTYDYRWSGQVLSSSVLGIRSLGRDGSVGPATNPYSVGPFLATQYDQDIIWSDGFFVHYPAGVASR